MAALLTGHLVGNWRGLMRYWRAARFTGLNVDTLRRLAGQ